MHSGCGRTYGEHRIGHWKAESFTFEAVKCVLVKALDLELRRSSPAAADSPATWLARLLMSPAERVTAAAGAQGGMAAHKIPISTACHPDITSERHLHYLRANHPHPSPCDTPTQPNSSGEPFLDPPLIRGQSPLCSRHCGSATRPPRSSPPALGAPPGFLGALHCLHRHLCSQGLCLGFGGALPMAGEPGAPGLVSARVALC